MSEYSGEFSGGDSDGASSGDSGGGNSGGINPAWNDVLNVVPEDIRGQVTPHLQQWDRNYSNLQQEHSRLSPFKSFADQGISVEQLHNGYGLMQAIQQNPREVYEALAQSFGLGESQGQDGPEVPDDLAGLPPEVIAKIQRLESGYELLAQARLEETSKQQQAQQDAELDRTVANLKSQFGDFDESYVLAQMYSGHSPEDAVKAYNTLVENVLANHNRPKPPKIMGAGGSQIPGERRLDVTKLDSGGTKNLVADMLRAAAQQSQ